MLLGLTLAAALTSASFQAAETFYMVGVTEDAIFVVDRATVRGEGARRTALLLTAMAEPQMVSGKPYQQAELFMEFDCENHRSRARRMIARTIEGDYVGEDARPDQWAVNGGSMRTAEDLVCRNVLPSMRPSDGFAIWKRVFLEELASRRGE